MTAELRFACEHMQFDLDPGCARGFCLFFLTTIIKCLLIAGIFGSL